MNISKWNFIENVNNFKHKITTGKDIFVLAFVLSRQQWFNKLRPRQNGCHFADDTYKCIFLNENVGISIKISLKFVPKGPINNNPTLVWIMAWHQPGDKPLSETMMVILPTHICVTRPQWVNTPLLDKSLYEVGNQINIYHACWYPIFLCQQVSSSKNKTDYKTSKLLSLWFNSQREQNQPMSCHQIQIIHITGNWECVVAPKCTFLRVLGCHDNHSRTPI